MTLHDEAVATLGAWRGEDVRQEGLRRLFLRHLTVHPDGTSRSGRPDHLTASAVVLDTTGERVLLTLHRTCGLWLQMGGHCETGDQSLRAAACREALEESGIDGLEVSLLPLRLDRHQATCGAAHHLDVQFLALAPVGAVEVISEESLDLAWFPVRSLPEPTDAALRTLVARAARHVRTLDRRATSPR